MHTSSQCAEHPELIAVPDALGLSLPIRPINLEHAGQQVRLMHLARPLVFARKPSNMSVAASITDGARSVDQADAQDVLAFGLAVLPVALFDRFASTLLEHRDWLGKFWEDGWRFALAHQAHELDGRLCVLVTAEDRPILAVDTQGSTYARYVAVLPNVLYSPPAAAEEPGPIPPELAKWAETTPALRQVLASIASRYLSMPTLESRRSDRLDFAEVSVWSVRDALLYAYTLGVSDGAETAA
jgi:hypothetical protein